jgi:UDP-N-acetylglucosamine 4,6-dehydratase
MFNNQTILVTGATGSFGKCFIRMVLEKYSPERLIVFSRDELKQFEMQQEFSEHLDVLRFFLGDVRDQERLNRAFNGVDIVVHAAALKQVEAAEYNPFETVKTNILGSENIINAAILNDVKKVIALSTDKAVNPVNLYGATKLASEKLFIAGNNYVGKNCSTRLSVVRYGNVIGSRGSVIPLFNRLKETGRLPVTDARMTRFWITIEGAVEFVIESIKDMKGGEIFVPKMPTTNIMDLAKAIAPECEIDLIGIRPGEKLHEALIMADESRHAVEQETRYVIQSPALFRNVEKHEGKEIPDQFSYASDNLDLRLGIADIQKMIEAFIPSKANV